MMGKINKPRTAETAYTRKTVSSEYGDVVIQVPRDRLGEFNPVVVKKHQTNVTGIEDQIIELYVKGVSTRDIQDHYMMIGIDLNGNNDVLGIWIGANESAKFWLTMLIELKIEGDRTFSLFADSVLEGYTNFLTDSLLN